MVRPSTSVKPEGDREWNTKRNDYQIYEKGMRPDKAKQNDSLR